MDRYTGQDAHAASCPMAVLSPSGKRLGSHVVETNARCVIEAGRVPASTPRTGAAAGGTPA